MTFRPFLFEHERAAVPPVRATPVPSASVLPPVERLAVEPAPGQRGDAAAGRMGPYFAPTLLAANLGGAFDLSHISPYAITAMKGPRLPALQGAGFYQLDSSPSWESLRQRLSTDLSKLGRDVEMHTDGSITIGGAPLAVIPNATQLVTQPIYQPSTTEDNYGDMSSIELVLAANQTVQVLGRPSYKRVLLQIQNVGGANSLTYKLGAPANAASTLIAAGGSSSYLDAVPQNELWLFSTLGTTVVVNYIDRGPPTA